MHVYHDEKGTRLAITKNNPKLTGDWQRSLTWEEIQKIKSAIGYGDICAFEVFPRDCDEVNILNLRWIWLLDKNDTIGWVNEEN